jgi:23S rRNA pseudouridine1911/1915/1917 synthase
MPIHPSMKNYTNTLANGLAYYFEQQNKPFIFRCNNRLDRDTSGLTLISKHLVSGNILSSMVSRREIHREYLAIVEGHVTPLSGTIDAPIARKPDSIMERIVDFEHGERAVTHYQVVSYSPSYTFVSLRLETGRTHQIRVHMKYLGYPLIGDFLYNPNTKDINRQALHSHKLSFSHPITGEEMSFVAPLPDDMARIIYTK